jgi:hypothetical protein
MMRRRVKTTLGGLLLVAAVAFQPGAAAAEQQEDPEDPPREPTDPITLTSGAAGKNYLNLSLNGLVVAGGSSENDVPGLQLGSHDPSRNGFTLQNVELVINGAVDPYFTAQANVVFVESPGGQTEVEMEELFATTSSLPHNLQVRAGHFFTEFGRLNTQHPHSWDFVDQPLSHARMFGSDGLRSTGARVSWLMPTPFYSELYLTIQNAYGETLTSFGWATGETVFGATMMTGSVEDLSDMLYVPRYAFSVDVTDNQTILAGVSSAFGPNGTGPNGETRLYGADFFWKWKSPRANQGFPFVKVQAEGIWRNYDVDGLTASLEDRGAYGQVLWGFHRGWVAGARYDRMGGDEGPTPDPFVEDRRRSSVNLTWFMTEYSKLRLQYNHDERTDFPDADSVWLQFELTLGAHAAHKF